MANSETGAGDHPIANLCIHLCCGFIEKSKIAGEKHHAYLVFSAEHHTCICRGVNVAGICESSYGLVEPADSGPAGPGDAESFLLQRRFSAAFHPEFLVDDWSKHPDHDGRYAGDFVRYLRSRPHRWRRPI